MSGFSNEGFYSQENPGYGYDQGQDYRYEMNPAFGQEQNFQTFEYNNESQPPQQHQQEPYYDPMASYGNYSGKIFTPAPIDYTSTTGTDIENEPPLLEELGINPDHIIQKTLTVLNPFRAIDPTILQDTDLAGPLAFCLAFGTLLLLSGKVHFGYIYGIGVLGCLGMYALLNLMSLSGVSIGVVISVLGYCLLPMVALSGLGVGISLQSFGGVLLTILTILWCSISASKLFVSALSMDHKQPLVAYPCALVYGVFALMTMF